VHARSTFLQGVLLAGAGDRPAYFARFSKPFQSLSDCLAQSGLSALQLCLRFMLEKSGVDRVLVGVTSESELSDILAALSSTRPLPDIRHLASADAALVDPRQWPSRVAG